MLKVSPDSKPDDEENEVDLVLAVLRLAHLVVVQDDREVVVRDLLHGGSLLPQNRVHLPGKREAV